MKKPVVLIVMDGVGVRESDFGNAVTKAYKPTLEMLTKTSPYITIKAHGMAVGLPSDEDMGNSEVGHNAIGCGQIYSQGAKLVNESIEDGSMYTSETWKELVSNTIEHNSTLHFIGLLSDGNVHAHINHLKAMIREAKKEGAKKVRVHALLDGRDVPAQSALDYVNDIEALFAELNGADFDARIASGGGRMHITMDRYGADWAMVKRGWDTHVLGKGDLVASATEAIEKARAASPNIIDQDLPAFVVAENGEPVGKIVDNDSVILFNFRGDRAQELSIAFDAGDEFDKFDREHRPDVVYAGMLQYDGDLKIPHKFLVFPPKIRNTLTELLVANNIAEYAVSETQKYGHVTYFWNGNKSGKFSAELEDYCEIPSDNVPFNERPWMKGAEITDKIIEALDSKKYGFIRANYPNGDMVGHTGVFQAVEIAVESVDLCLSRVLEACVRNDAILIVTADHGNADEMLEKSKSGEAKPKTAHSLSPVPFIIFDKDTRHEMKDGDFGLTNIAATVAELLELTPHESWKPSMLK